MSSASPSKDLTVPFLKYSYPYSIQPVILILIPTVILVVAVVAVLSPSSLTALPIQSFTSKSK
jgi:hypothetical protein